MCTHLPLHESLAILTHWSMFQQLLCILSLDTPRWLVTRSWKNRGSKLGPKSTGYSSRWRDLLIHRQLHMPHQLIWMMNLLWHLTSKFWSQWSEWLSTYFYSSSATQQACDVLLKTWTIEPGPGDDKHFLCLLVQVLFLQLMFRSCITWSNDP